MKPKSFLTVCIIVMAVSVAVMAYDYFVASPSALETYVISNWTFGAAMLARPALLAAAGALMSGRDDMKIAVCGNDVRATVYASFDNLGKGASGAAVQCFNLMCGKDEKYSLVTGD